MQEELRDLYADIQEVQDIMGRSYDVDASAEMLDDEELEAELEGLALDMDREREQDDTLLKKMLSTPDNQLPVDTNKPNQTHDNINDKTVLEKQTL